MKIQQLSADDALRSLRSGRFGLAGSEAERRLARHGANRIERAERAPLLARFLAEFTHFFALILWLAAALAFFAAYRDPAAGMHTLGFAIIGVIVVNGVFSFWQEYRAEQALAALQRLLPAVAKVLRDGAAREVPAERVVPGDVVLLQEGDDVPADGRMIECHGLRVNDAAITGESIPTERLIAPDPVDDAVRARNVALAGTQVVAGWGKMVVYATGMNTEFGHIARLTQAVSERLSPLQAEIRRLSGSVAVIACALGLVFFVIGHLLGLPFWYNLVFAIGVIVALVPEGLLPTVTLALAMATQRMARRNALIRHLPAVEALGSTTVICTDKTGTLTRNEMRVRVFQFADSRRELDGVVRDGVEAWQRPLFEAALHCHDLREIAQGDSIHWHGDPMEIALRGTAARLIGEEPAVVRRDEIAFDPERKRLSVLCETPRGTVLYCKGALETVLPCCTGWAVPTGMHALDATACARFREIENELADAGMRVLAFAYRPLNATGAPESWEQDLVLAGLVGLADPLRPEVPPAVAMCRAAGIRVIMISGDHPRTAAAVAREAGIIARRQPAILTGAQLSELDDAALERALGAGASIFARVGPMQKLRIVKALQARGEIVGVTGDGVNDAPALKRADIGIAMGVAGTDVAKEAADMVLLDDNFASIVAAIEEGRAVYENVRKFLTYILTSNVPELVPYLAFALFRIPLPLTIVQILAVDLGTDMLPALALGAEKPSPDTMRRPPRPRTERLLNGPLLARAFLVLGPLQALAAMSAFFFVLLQGGWSYGEPLAPQLPLYLQATSACLAAIVITQVANVFACRHPERSAFDFGLLGNSLLPIAIAFELAALAAILYTPLGNAVFGTAPLPLAAWLFVLPFACGLLLADEARKLRVRRMRRRMVA